MTCGPLVPRPSRKRPPDSCCSDIADHRQVGRSAGAELDDPRRQPDSLGPGREEGERRQGVGAPDLGHPHRVGPEPLGVDHELGVGGRRDDGADGDAHGPILARHPAGAMSSTGRGRRTVAGDERHRCPRAALRRWAWHGGEHRHRRHTRTGVDARDGSAATSPLQQRVPGRRVAGRGHGARCRCSLRRAQPTSGDRRLADDIDDHDVRPAHGLRL